MWTPLTSLSQEDYRHLGTLPGDDDTVELAETIRMVAEREYADALSAVTSMGNLSLTTARTYDDHHHHWHHPRISLSLHDDRKIGISYNPGGERDHQPTASTIVATPAEAAEYIDMLMIRMPHDTAEITKRIADAIERKAAHEHTKTE